VWPRDPGTRRRRRREPSEPVELESEQIDRWSGLKPRYALLVVVVCVILASIAFWWLFPNARGAAGPDPNAGEAWWVFRGPSRVSPPRPPPVRTAPRGR
jgi:hypothetical protein